MAREKVITTAPADEVKKAGRRAAPEAAQGGHRPAEGRGAARDRRPRSKKLKEPLGHILFDGPPGLGKTTFATVLPNELGTSIQMTSGPALVQAGRPAAVPHQPRRRLDPVHRRDPPHAADRRGVHLPGDGGLPHRHRPRRRHERPHHLDAAEAVHAHRRDHAQRHALRPDARPLQDARAPGVLLASRSWPQIVTRQRRAS